MNPDYYKDEIVNRKYYEKSEYKYKYGGDGWENSQTGGKTFTVTVLSGPDAGALLDYYYYSVARRKMNELLVQGICAIMRLDNGS